MGLDKLRGKPCQVGRCLLCLRQEREGNQRVSGEQIEGSRAIVRLFERAFQRVGAGPRQRLRQGCSRPGSSRIVGHAVAQRVRAFGGATLQPDA